MKKIFFLLAGIFMFIININAQTIFYVIKPGDFDPFIYQYNYIDSLCDTTMYGTLQWAERKSLDTPGPCEIRFAIPGAGPHIIYLNGFLPGINKKVYINGTTQPGYQVGNPQIILDGQNTVVQGLFFYHANGSIIEGLYIKNVTTQGIGISGTDSLTVKDCIINRIFNGASTDAAMGIVIVNSSYSIIQGNIFGTDNLNSVLPIEDYGIFMWLSSNNSVIGGTVAGESNIFRNCGFRAITIGANCIYNRISGNIITDCPNAIYLGPGANLNKPSPVIVSATTNFITGTSESGDIIEIFGSTGNENANEYFTITQTDINGNWSTSLSTSFSYIIATATDNSNNSSMLSASFQKQTITTKLISSDCGLTNVAFNQDLTSEIISGAEKYEFFVENNDLVFSESITKGTNVFNLLEVSDNIQYNTDYSISVRTIMDNDTSEWGEVCFITTWKEEKFNDIETISEFTLQSNPEIKEEIDYKNQIIQNYINEKSTYSGPKSTINYVIPVVVHVIHSGEPYGTNPNISYAQIQNQITALNQKYAGVYSIFNGTEDVTISFCLASNLPVGTSEVWAIGPGGNEYGVTRRNSTLTNHDFNPTDANQLFNLIHFPIDQYLNIWIVSAIEPNGAGIYQGYAPQPLQSNLNIWELDGIVMRSTVFGSDPSFTFGYDLYPNRREGEILAHEVGHYLDVIHVFESGTCAGSNPATCQTEGDNVCDTPPCMEPASTSWCSDPNQNTCTETPSGLDPIHNYMYKAWDFCWTEFTTGQIERMISCIDLLRPNLVTEQNLIYTGVINPNGCMSPVLAAYFDNPSMSCVGTNVQFNSVLDDPGVIVNSWIWDFGDGTNNTTDTDPVHIYNVAGVYNVILTAINGGNTVVESSSIYISPCTNINLSQANWIFGRYCALDFQSGLPVVSNVALTNNTIYSVESAITESDPLTGELVFYASGEHVWNRFHIEIPLVGGQPLGGHISSSQMVSVPFPNHANQFFLIMPRASEQAYNGIRYALVDANGTGNLLSQNQILSLFPGVTQMSEVITCVPHCNGIDYWVITHGHSNDGRFFVYLVTENGVSNPLNFSLQSPVSYGPFLLKGTVGQLKASPNGEFLALTIQGVGSPNGCGLYHFNNSTGEIASIWEKTGLYYSCSFDHSSTYLYATFGSSWPPTQLFQYDLLGNPLLVAQNSTNPYRRMGLGPDNNIYINKFNTNNMHVIMNSNTPTPVYMPDFINFSSVSTLLMPISSVPNMIDAVKPAPSNPDFTVAVSSNCIDVTVDADDCFDGYYHIWNFGDGTITTQNPGNVPLLNHSYSTNGNFTITLDLAYYNSITGYQIVYSIQHNVYIGVPIVNISGINTACLGSETHYNANNSGVWAITSGSGNFVGPNSGDNVTVIWSSTGTNSLSLTVTDPLSNCSGTDNIVVQVFPVPVVSYTNGNSCNGICNGSISINASGGTPPYSYYWNNGLTGSNYNNLCSGTYDILVSDANCSANPISINLLDYPAPIITLVNITPSDPCIPTCNGSIDISVSGGGAPYTYQWGDGENPPFPITQDLNNACVNTYMVFVTNSFGCTAMGTFSVPLPLNYQTITSISGITQSGTTTIVNGSCTIPFGSTFEIPGQLTINALSTLIVDGTLRFTSGKKLFVSPRASLVVSSTGVLTSNTVCPALWYGVWAVKSTTALPHTVIDINYGTIENATTGIYASGWVRVNSLGGTYNNNRQSIYLVNSRTEFTGMHDISLNNFNTTSASMVIPYAQLTLNNAHLVKISTNIFTNFNSLSSTGSPVGRGIGINVIGTNNQIYNVSSCTFSGLQYGIKADYMIDVDNNTFNNNNRGVLIENTNSSGSKIIHNTFDGNKYFNNNDINTYPWGIGLQNCPNVTVERNTVINGFIGIGLINNSTNVNIIYNNEIYGNSVGLGAYMKNNMKLTCNDFVKPSPSGLASTNPINFNTKDIIVNAGSLFINQDQAYWAINLGISINSHNRFTKGKDLSSSPEYALKFKIKNPNPITYYQYYFGAYNPTPGGINDLTRNTPLPTSSVPYITNIGNIALPWDSSTYCKPIVLTLKSVHSSLTQIDSLKDIAENQLNYYNEIVDNGNTDYFLSLIENLRPNNFNSSYAILMNASPYLSDSVLIAFMTNPINKPPQKTNLVLANSPLPNKVRSYINQMNVNNHFKLVMWAAQNGNNLRENIENSIANNNFGIDSKFGMVLTTVLNDSLYGSSVVDSVLTYVLQSGTLNERLITNPVFIGKEKYSDAQSNLNSISSLNNTTDFQIDDFIQLQQFEIQLCQAPDSVRKSLIQQNESWISDIAANPSHFCQSSGLSLLEELYDTTFARAIDLGDDFSGRYIPVKQEETVEETGCVFIINPNPANEIISVLLNPEEITGEETISIYNSEGKKVKFITAEKNRGLYIIDVSNLIKGNYIVDLENKGVILCAQKLIVE